MTQIKQNNYRPSFSNVTFQQDATQFKAFGF